MASNAVESNSQRIHSELDHPVIDADGHNLDFMPLLEDYIREFGGAKAVDHYRSVNRWFAADDETRRRLRLARPTFWGYPTELTIDQMTSIVPALLDERLSEMGLDFSVIFPSPLRLGVPHLADDELRQPLCRALNHYQSDLLGPFSARLAPAAVIPMHTPTEAMEELDYAVNTLGMKVMQMASYVQRVRSPEGSDGTARTQGTWWDILALDSQFDYDPVWEKCRDLRAVVGFHSGTMGVASRTSYSNHVYNHIGHFASGCEPICKALILGGVTRRFPELRFVFLESGAGWATNLYCDLMAHWKLRNVSSVRRYDPSRFDYDLAGKLFEEYATGRMLEKLDRIREIDDRMSWLSESDNPRILDEFAEADLSSVEDVRDRFVPNFFFGCEGEDPMTPLAFNKEMLPLGVKLNAVFGSDIGHEDVPDMRDVLKEAHELVDDGMLDPSDFRRFVFSNPVKLLAGLNRDFFVGTAIEDAVAKELAELNS